jgi:hypothetical protein
MTSATAERAFDPQRDGHISREMLEQLDEAPTSRENWKILLFRAWGSSPTPTISSSSAWWPPS